MVKAGIKGLTPLFTWKKVLQIWEHSTNLTFLFIWMALLQVRKVSLQILLLKWQHNCSKCITWTDSLFLNKEKVVPTFVTETTANPRKCLNNRIVTADRAKFEYIRRNFQNVWNAHKRDCSNSTPFDSYRCQNAFYNKWIFHALRRAKNHTKVKTILAYCIWIATDPSASRRIFDF